MRSAASASGVVGLAAVAGAAAKSSARSAATIALLLAPDRLRQRFGEPAGALCAKAEGGRDRL
jgi:hypothetical protein